MIPEVVCLCCGDEDVRAGLDHDPGTGAYFTSNLHTEECEQPHGNYASSDARGGTGTSEYAASLIRNPMYQQKPPSCSGFDNSLALLLVHR
jgi:hypothetical protein